jgi:murein DD-endopeptidase MepM/ murein hydrolase activator NlpD
MRPLIAVIGASVFASTLALASITTGASSRALPTPAARFTPDPVVTSRVIPGAAYGRIAPDDRIDRTRRSVFGLALPIEGAAVPLDPELLPNAARDFRAGWHEGIDFAADDGTPVHAVADGVISRIDHDFADWTFAEEQEALAAAVELGYTPSATLDRVRGRQVWIDHGGGITSRYAHLSAVLPELAVGVVVTRGQVIGTVGKSGYPEGGPHLHLEVRLGSSYLGDGLSGDGLAAVIAAAFSAR